jgi:HK97 family phage prohead protease
MKNLSTEFGERLVTLHTGAEGLRSAMTVTAKAAEGSAPMVTFVSSDATLDRYNEVVQADGWVLDNYLKNPVFQDSHNYESIVCTIGKATRTVVQSGKLVQDVVFAVAENPLAKLAYDLYRGGFLNAVSVGFIPMEWTNGDQQAGYRRKYTKQELLETSAVSIPANPNALALAMQKGAVDGEGLRELSKLLKHYIPQIEGKKSIAEREISCPDCSVKLIHNLEAKVLTCKHCGYEGPAEKEGNAGHRLSILQDAQLLQMFRETASLCRRA